MQPCPQVPPTMTIVFSASRLARHGDETAVTASQTENPLNALETGAVPVSVCSADSGLVPSQLSSLETLSRKKLIEKLKLSEVNCLRLQKQINALRRQVIGRNRLDMLEIPEVNEDEITHPNRQKALYDFSSCSYVYYSVTETKWHKPVVQKLTVTPSEENIPIPSVLQTGTRLWHRKVSIWKDMATFSDSSRLFTQFVDLCLTEVALPHFNWDWCTECV